ncbi:alpha/beta fold hydrolase [Serinicoccus marinus]|uniref:alpha/beta fold hydrolase n=1 Tax=Serinicoccus marinus TaxID=247333 RepID=UPI0023B10F36|nr:alpha/beta fold hydrolase [Serinicoccus marinus]
MDSDGDRVEQLSHAGLRHQALVGGPCGGEPVVLLHGFPQDATAWRALAPLLHDAGLRTLAPHQRGYGPGSAPTCVSAYRLDSLVGTSWPGWTRRAGPAPTSSATTGVARWPGPSGRGTPRG